MRSSTTTLKTVVHTKLALGLCLLSGLMEMLALRRARRRSDPS